MLSRQARVNILLTAGVEGNVSFSLFDVTLDQAVRQIASAAGFAVEQRDGTYYIIDHEEIGKYQLALVTELRTFKVEYSDVKCVRKRSVRPFPSMSPVAMPMLAWGVRL